MGNPNTTTSSSVDILIIAAALYHLPIFASYPQTASTIGVHLLIFSLLLYPYYYKVLLLLLLSSLLSSYHSLLPSPLLSSSSLLLPSYPSLLLLLRSPPNHGNGRTATDPGAGCILDHCSHCQPPFGSAGPE